MSTLAEIQEAVAKLGDEDKKALSVWLDSQAEPVLSSEDEQKLLRSLDEAIRSVDTGKGVPIDEVRNLVRSWAAK